MKSSRPGTGRGRRLVVAVFLGAAALLGIGWAFADVGPSRSADGSDRQAAPVARSTSEVRRDTLIDGQRFPADLAYGQARDLSPIEGGVLTWVPPSPTVIGHGDILWRIDDRPTLYLEGGLPLYRDLYRGVKRGADVEQLERLLAEMGFGPEGWEADNSFNRTTAAAVKQLEKQFGLVVDGRISQTEVYVGLGGLRVDSTANVGDRVSSETTVLTITETTAVVKAVVTSRQYAWLKDQAATSVVLAGGQVSDVELVDATALTDESGSVSYQITFTGDDLAADPQPVELVVEETIAVDALIVPVDALVALVEGGYAVELDTDEGTVLRPVEVLGFDDTSVAVDGQLVEGDNVIVP